MITVGMNYHVIDGKQATFEKMFARVVEALNAAEGHDRSTLYVAVDDPQSYCIISQWNDEGAFKAFIGSEQFRKVTDWGSEQILDRRPEHQVYGS